MRTPHALQTDISSAASDDDECVLFNPTQHWHPHPQCSTPRPSNRLLMWSVAVVLVACATCFAAWHSGTAPTVKARSVASRPVRFSHLPTQAFLGNSLLGRSGFLASLSLIFLSEIGDKTFFIAALMAMKLGQAVAFSGTMAALSVMSVVSVAIGFVCKNVPSLVQTSAPVGEYLGVALLLYFGVKSLKVSDGVDVVRKGDLCLCHYCGLRWVVRGKWNALETV